MPHPTGPFHSLTTNDTHQLHRLLKTGISLRAATTQIGCNYKHAWNYAHTHHLINYRPHTPTDQATTEHFLNLLRTGHTLAHAQRTTGLGDTRATNLAITAGLHTPLSRTQRRIHNTDQRVEYLRLRLAGLPKRDAAGALGIDIRLAHDYERGLTKTTGPRQHFLPAGPDARTYNRLMTALITRTDVIEPGRLPEPALPADLNPYTPINARFLSLDERILIADLHRAGHRMRAIARQLGRTPSTISREIRRNHSAQGPYMAETAQKKAAARRLRPKPGKLQARPRLHDYVVNGLRAQWSPEQIARRLVVDHPEDQQMRISHETIYDAFYLESKGRLKDLGLQLPTGRKKRRRREPARTATPGRFVDQMVLIDDRPDEVNQRILPGHWEGDLICGAGNKSAVVRPGFNGG